MGAGSATHGYVHSGAATAGGARRRHVRMSASRFRSSDIVFLDKDGTLITNVPYSVNCDLITLAPGAADALRTFAGAGLDVAVVSNQPGVAFGRFTEDALDAVRDRLAEMI